MQLNAEAAQESASPLVAVAVHKDRRCRPPPVCGAAHSHTEYTRMCKPVRTLSTLSVNKGFHMKACLKLFIRFVVYFRTTVY